MLRAWASKIVFAQPGPTADVVALNPRIEKGFDFLGYHFGPDGLGVARATIEKFIKRASRLYEQERIGKVAPDALGMYVRRWVGWASGGLHPAGGPCCVPRLVYAGFYAVLS